MGADAERSEKVRENRLRRMAERQGLRLEKSRRRDPRALDYGTYQLVREARRERLARSGAGRLLHIARLRAEPRRRGASLDRGSSFHAGPSPYVAGHVMSRGEVFGPRIEDAAAERVDPLEEIRARIVALTALIDTAEQDGPEVRAWTVERDELVDACTNVRVLHPKRTAGAGPDPGA